MSPITAEYSGDPSTSDKDAVRFLIHDTDVEQGNELLQDEEILWLLTEQPNAYLAAASACETLASRFRGSATSKSVGGLSISYSTRADEFAAQAKLLRDQGAVTGVPIPISTAQSKEEKSNRAADADLNLTPFALGMHDNEGSGAYAG